MELATRRGSLRLWFRPGDDRAFVVGNCAGADLRLTSASAGAVAFHLERRGARVELFPGDASREIYVDAGRVTRPVLLRQTSVIDVGEDRIVATTFDATELAQTVTFPRAGAERDRVTAPQRESDPTRLGLPAPELAGPVTDALPTVAYAPGRTREPAPSPEPPRWERTEPLNFAERPVVREPLGPTGTQIVSAAELNPPRAPAPEPRPDAVERSETPAPPTPAPEADPDGVALTRKRDAASEPPAPKQATIADEPAQRSAPSAASPPAHVDKAPERRRKDIGRATTALDVRALAPPMVEKAPARPATRRPSPAVEQPTLVSPPARGAGFLGALGRFARGLATAGKRSPAENLAAVGRVARKRPLVVFTVSIMLACGGAVALTALSRLGPRSAPRTPQPPLHSQVARPAGDASARASGALRPAPLGGPRTAISGSAPPAASESPPPPTSAVPELSIRAPAPAAEPFASPAPAGADPDVAAAIDALVAGRDAEARLAYARLASRPGANPAYAALAALLTRAAGDVCQGAAAEDHPFCPEVKR